MSLKNFFGGLFTRPHPRKQPQYDVALTAKNLKEIFSDCADYQTREISVGGGSGLVTVCYIDGVVDGDFLSHSVIRPLTDSFRLTGCSGSAQCIEQIMRGAVYSGSASVKDTADDAVAALANGFTLIVFDREKKAVAFETRSGVQRSISEPSVEKTVKGAKDSFIERIRTNTTLVRRRLRTPDLKMVKTTVGRRSHTDVYIAYLSQVANPKLVEELTRRLNSIDIDGLVTAGNLESYIADNPSSPFPQILHTERPDRFAISLLEGKVGLLVDGLPFGFLIPCTLGELMQVPEDRVQHFLISSILRLLRYVSLAVTLLLPAVYVAMAMYHQEMLPLKLLLSIIQSKQEVPFSTAVEILGMLVAFEILQEAGLRLPDPVGQTVSIIGALIVGQSAVEAKVISPIAVIVVAAAGITGYTIPDQDLSNVLRVWRFLLVVCALLAGMVGIFAGMLLVIFHLCCLESFGVSFLSPLSDGGPGGIFALIFRRSVSGDKNRPEYFDPINKRNQI